MLKNTSLKSNSVFKVFSFSPVKPVSLVAIAVAFHLQIGCASVDRAVDRMVAPDGRFPSPQELHAIAKDNPDLVVSSTQEAPVVVDRWVLTGPFTDKLEVSAVSGGGPAYVLLDDKVRTSAGLAVRTTQSDCVARELGQFYAAHKGFTDDDLRSFIEARCGAVSRHQASYLMGEVAEDDDNDAIIEQWRDSIAAQLESISINGPTMLGGALVRHGNKAVWVTVSSQRQFDISPVDIVGQDFVQLDGNLFEAGREISAWVTRGKDDAVECQKSVDVARGAFSIQCPIDVSSPTTTLEISAVAPGRILGKSVMQTLFFNAPNVEDNNVYTAPPHLADLKALGSSSQFDLLTAVNAIRQGLDRDPLLVSHAQSSEIDAVAPAFYASQFGLRSAIDADRIMLGLMAGWDVEGNVLGGSVVALRSDKNHPELGLAAKLRQPTARRALLSHLSNKSAFGKADLGDRHGYLLATYVTLDDDAERDPIADLLARIEKHRATAGARTPQVSQQLATMSNKVASDLRNGGELADAMNRLGKAASTQWNTGVRMYGATGNDAASLKIPDEVLQSRSENLAISAAWTQPAGEPWVQLHAVFVVGDEPDEI